MKNICTEAKRYNDMGRLTIGLFRNSENTYFTNLIYKHRHLLFLTIGGYLEASLCK